MSMRPEELTGLRILVADDEPGNVDVLRRLLERAGYHRVTTVTDSKQVIDSFREICPDLLLLDLRMPSPDGFEILRMLEEEVPAGQYFPVLVLTGDLAPEVKERALLAGARDFLTKPFNATEVLLRVRNLLETRALHLKLQRHAETLEDRVQERTQELARAQVEILHRLALAAEYRDDVTGHHAERVGMLSAFLGAELELPDQEVALLRRAATLHDVGKIGIPDAVLMKPGSLTPQEFELMKTHTEIGARILSGSSFPLLQMAQEIARAHHEKWDGSGYGEGASGEDIPLVGRIVAVADVFDSLTHERPYKAAVTADRAVEVIRRTRGSHFDPQVVDAFLALEVRGALDRLSEASHASLVEALGTPGFLPLGDGQRDGQASAGAGSKPAPAVAQEPDPRDPSSPPE